MENIEVKWAIHEDVVAMEHSLKVIASVRPRSHCGGSGVRQDVADAAMLAYWGMTRHGARALQV